MYLYGAGTRVRKIVDGDTIICNVDLGFYTQLNNIRFRFKDYQAPELRGKERAMGLEAKRYLQTLLKVNQPVAIKTYKADAFGRWLADIIWHDGRTLQEHLIEQGYGIFWDGKGKRPVFETAQQYPDPNLRLAAHNNGATSEGLNIPTQGSDQAVSSSVGSDVS